MGTADAKTPEPDPAAVQETVRRFLRAFPAPAPLLAAVSGGSDSTALLVAFAAVLREPGFSRFSLHAVTVDHGLRPGSGEEAEAAGQLARRHGISHRVLPWTGEKPASGLQAAARAARYRLLVAEARRLGGAVLLTGHTVEDQRETIGMRQRRGEGPGLAGMAPATLLEEKIWLLRPFLDTHRQALRAHLTASGESWIDDPSNANPRFERARMREEPASAPASAPLTGAERLARAEAEAGWLRWHARVAGGLVAIVRRESLGMADGDTALFRLAAAIGGRIHLPGGEQRQRLRAFLAAGMPGRRTLAGTVFDLRGSGLYLYREARNLPALTLPPRETALWDGRLVLSNDGTQAMHLPGGPDNPELVAALMTEGVPEGVARRAARAAPVASEGAGTAITIRPHLAPHAGLLPGFDLASAAALRQLFALPPLSPPPISAECWPMLWPGFAAGYV